MTRYAPAVSTLFKFSVAVVAMTLLLSHANLRAQQPAQNSQQQQQQQIKTLAVVNGEQITRQQVANECMRRFGKDTLEDIINTFLVAQELQRAGIVITEKDVNDQIIAKAASFNLSADRYLQTICGNRNITPDRLKNDVIWKQLALERLAAAQITVTPQEIKERMDYEFGERVQVRQIVVESLQKATQIRNVAAANPDDFVRLAKQHSLDQNSGAYGGLMPPIRRNSSLPELETLAFGLAEGEVSRVIPIAENFVILRCEKKYAAETVPPEQLSYAHDRIVEQITNDKLKNAAGELFARLQKETRITNVMNDPEQAKRMPGVAALVNNHQILVNKVAEDCISRFGHQMLDTEINRTILLQAMKKRGVQFSQPLIDAEINRAAAEMGYLNPDGSVNREQWLTYVTGNDPAKTDFYIEDEIWPTVALKELVKNSVTVTSEDLQKAFEANFGPRVEVLAILMNNNRTANKVCQMAGANPDPKYFGQLANQYSTDPMTRNNFGEMPPIPRHGGVPALEKEAFSLKPGEISQVVQMGPNFVVLYCKGMTEPVVGDFDAVKDDLQSDILEKKLRIAMASEFQKLREIAQIDNFLAGTSQPGAAAVQAARQAMQQQKKLRKP